MYTYNPEDVVRVMMPSQVNDSDYVIISIAIHRRCPPAVISVEYKGNKISEYPFEVDELHAICVAQKSVNRGPSA